MPAIIVDETVCKGCGMCVLACPRHIVELDMEKLNAKGYHPAMLVDKDRCTGCRSCAIMCPDVAITVVG